MDKKIEFEDLRDEIVNDVRRYTTQVRDLLFEAVDEISKPMESEIIERSPVSNDGEDEYKSGWKRTVVINDRKSTAKATVRNINQPHLVHLLELGHLARDGVTEVEPSPLAGHVMPSESEAMEKLEKEIEAILNRER